MYGSVHCAGRVLTSSTAELVLTCRTLLCPSFFRVRLGTLSLSSLKGKRYITKSRDNELTSLVVITQQSGVAVET